MKRKQDAGVESYRRLFILAPELRGMFKADMSEQARKLMDTLAVAVSMLHDLPKLEAALRDLGTRHLEYGVKAEHYTTVGIAP